MNEFTCSTPRHAPSFPYQRSDIIDSSTNSDITPCKSSQNRRILCNLSTIATFMSMAFPQAQQRAVGLQNLGATCYLNASLQCLRSTNLYNYILSGCWEADLNEATDGVQARENSMVVELCRLYQEMDRGGTGALHPTAFVVSLILCYLLLSFLCRAGFSLY